MSVSNTTYRTIEVLAVGGLLYLGVSALMSLASKRAETTLFRWAVGTHVLGPSNRQDLVPLVEGAWLTIQLCAVSGVLGVIFGLILGIARTSPSKIARWISTIYISCVRGIPVLVIIFFVFFGIPLLFPGLEPDKFSSAVIALTCFAAAYVAEIVRGSIEAVAKGQSEAADALGLDYWRKLRYVILPRR